MRCHGPETFKLAVDSVRAKGKKVVVWTKKLGRVCKTNKTLDQIRDRVRSIETLLQIFNRFGGAKYPTLASRSSGFRQVSGMQHTAHSTGALETQECLLREENAFCGFIGGVTPSLTPLLCTEGDY